jgi:hypothetical protein
VTGDPNRHGELIPHRVLDLPWEGAEALRTTLGIVEDNEVPLDAELCAGLDRRLRQLFDDGDRSTPRPFELSIHEADTLVAGLQFTEAMSVHLDFFDMVQDTCRFVADQLRSLWSDDEWAAYHAPS